jgi:hypothetical protein
MIRLQNIIKAETSYKGGIIVTLHSEDRILLNLVGNYLARRFEIMAELDIVKKVIDRGDVIILLPAKGVSQQELIATFNKVVGVPVQLGG